MKLRKRMRVMGRALHMELREHKSSFLVYVTLRLLVILMMILQIFIRNYENVFLCVNPGPAAHPQPDTDQPED